ncbi:MAG: glycosyltransferase family protein [Boseongicola sp.]
MTKNSTAPRVFFYVQHLLGIGHLARASRIADAMADDGFHVTVVTGGTSVAGFPGANVSHVALPPIVSGDAGFSGLSDAHGNAVDEDFKAKRRDLLQAAYRECRPDIVMIEAFPFGRRQVRFELIPFLEAIFASRVRPRVVCSVRDILQERAKPGRDQECVALVKQYFDLVLVHGDPEFIRLEETFPLADEIQGRIAYTGLVATPPLKPGSEKFDIVVSAGGGAVGTNLIQTAIEAASRLPKSGNWCVVTGPNLPAEEFDSIVTTAPTNVRVDRFRSDLPNLIAGARLSISQAGYNTVCDILNARCKSLLVPFAAGGETEQGVRAERLQKMELAHVLAESDLSADTMTESVATALSSPAPPAFLFGLDGARQTARILRELVASPV